VAEPGIEEEELHEDEENKSRETLQTLGEYLLEYEIDRVRVHVNDKITAIKRDDAD
jgi:hypothetical protein